MPNLELILDRFEQLLALKHEKQWEVVCTSYDERELEEIIFLLEELMERRRAEEVNV